MWGIGVNATALAASAVTALAATVGLVPSSAAGAPSAGTTATGAAASASGSVPGRFLLVGGTGTGNIGVFGVAGDGTLSKAPGSPFAGDTGFAIVVSPDGKRAYVASLSKKSVKGYAIGADGALTEIPGAYAEYDAAVVGVAFSPDGSRLFATVGGEESGTVQTLAVGSTGALTKTGAPATIPGTSFLSQPVVSADGRFVYATSFTSNTVTAFRIGADGSPTRIGEPLATGKGPALPNITPDGRFLYATNEQGANTSGYAIAEDGTLTPTPGSPYATGDLPHGGAVTPDSKRMYLPEAGSNKIAGFSIAGDGALTPLSGSPYPGPAFSMPGRVVHSPDAKRLFLIDVLQLGLSARVHTYDVDETDGRVAPTGQRAVDSGVFFADGPSSVITPNQGPVAEVDTVDTPDLTGVFSASDSSDSDGSVVSYHWDFGDGTIRTTRTPETSHTFTKAGSRTVTVTVTDNEGCSSTRVFNGQVVSCNGGEKSRAATRVDIG
ncbi:beta-propeller fold lactonase family protein [Streptomyces sp. MMCC 100]|uniref:beta-propeller fold lactonase family protein n=1 Tax=Streptomyces sp. MMCC 100 TaxID=3163555 RepID=UPI003594A6F5